jgi:hypothetical protein
MKSEKEIKEQIRIESSILAKNHNLALKGVAQDWIDALKWVLNAK